MVEPYHFELEYNEDDERESASTVIVNSLVIKKVTNWTDCCRMTGAFAFAFASIEVFGAQLRFCR